MKRRLRSDHFSEFRRFAERGRSLQRSAGSAAAMRRGCEKVAGWCEFGVWQSWGRRHYAFEFEGDSLRPFVNRYNNTWRNERAAEIPIALRFLRQHAGPVLEVGNVLSNYGFRGHPVVDKYERSSNVINVDILDFRPNTLFGAIACISTLEHIGWDERPIDSEKVAAALRHLRSLLLPNGRLLVTCPLGYNPNLDRRIETGSMAALSEAFLLKSDNRWREVDIRAALEAGVYVRKHGRGANALWVAQFGP